MSYSTTIIVKFQWWAIHRWPDAKPPHEYLADRHRHLFVAEAEIEVHHDDRELEFFDVLEFLEQQVQVFWDLGDRSCEMVASELIRWLHSKYGDRSIKMLVSEDGLNGARVTYTRPPREAQR